MIDRKHEALTLIAESRRLLEKALSVLSQAKSFGVWDLLGGGLVSGIGKYTKLNEVRRCVDEAQFKLKSLRKYLDDWDLCGTPSLNEFGSMMQTLDVILDCFGADVMVQMEMADWQRELQIMIVKLDTLKQRIL